MRDEAIYQLTVISVRATSTVQRLTGPDERNERLRDFTKTKMLSYLDRAEAIKAHIESKPSTASRDPYWPRSGGGMNDYASMAAALPASQLDLCARQALVGPMLAVQRTLAPAGPFRPCAMVRLRVADYN